jgi:cobalamin biosynthesis protein CobD/CbiB
MTKERKKACRQLRRDQLLLGLFFAAAFCVCGFVFKQAVRASASISVWVLELPFASAMLVLALTIGSIARHLEQHQEALYAEQGDRHTPLAEEDGQI